MELTIKAQDKNLQAATDFIHSAITDYCTNLIQNQIDLAIEEIFVNIAHYAYGKENTENEVKIVCKYEARLLTVTFIDSGIKFNPLEHPDPDITLSAKDRKIGGLGIFLTKKFMDKVAYEYRDGKNHLTFVKQVL